MQLHNGTVACGNFPPGKRCNLQTGSDKERDSQVSKVQNHRPEQHQGSWTQDCIYISPEYVKKKKNHYYFYLLFLIPKFLGSRWIFESMKWQSALSLAIITCGIQYKILFTALETYLRNEFYLLWSVGGLHRDTDVNSFTVSVTCCVIMFPDLTVQIPFLYDVSPAIVLLSPMMHRKYRLHQLIFKQVLSRTYSVFNWPVFYFFLLWVSWLAAARCYVHKCSKCIMQH